MEQLIINIEDHSIVPTIRHMLSLIKGITVQKAEDTLTYAEQVSPSGDAWWNNPANVVIVQKGKQQAENGQCVELSNAELQAMLGV